MDDLQRLRREADELLKQTKELVEQDAPPVADGAANQGGETRGLQDEADDSEETEQDILERALAEAKLEEAQGEQQPASYTMLDQPECGSESDKTPDSPNGTSKHRTTGDQAADSLADLDVRLSFPAIPTSAPIDTSSLSNSGDADAELEARMRLLAGLSGPSAAPFASSSAGKGLPSVPSAKPGTGRPDAKIDNRQVGQGWNLPGLHDGRDDDLDSWCCE
jgi:hypothetical protein